MRDQSSLRARHDRRLQDLKSRRSRWESHWRELAEYVSPKRWRDESRDDIGGDKERQKILDGSATLALRTLASGMHSGITSPARPWFRLATLDPDMRENGEVRTYLQQVEDRMRHVMATSNLYRGFHSGYADLGLMGQFAGLLTKDDTHYVSLMTFIHGEYWIANGLDGRAETLYRRCRMTVEQMMRRFGTSCSNTVQNMYARSQYDERVTVYHAVERRHDRDPSKPDKRNMPWLSNYWEEGATGDNMLGESGFRSNPILAPRWLTIGSDEYGQSPGMEALPDVKGLQIKEQRKLEAIDKMVRPPMKGPTSLKNEPKSLLPGSITYVDDPNGQGYTPAMQVTLRIAELAQDIAETRDRINRAFYADLFMMLQNLEGVQPRNVYELTKRQEEQLLQLGPVLENVYYELLEPTINTVFEACNEARILPPPPRDLEGKELKIEYISTLAQAQKAVATGSIERLAGFIGNLAGGRPEVLDKLDADQAVDVYADMIGAPPDIIVADDRVAEIRKQRTEMMQQQAQAEQAAKLAPAANQGANAIATLAQTDAGGGQPVQDFLANLGISGP